MLKLASFVSMAAAAHAFGFVSLGDWGGATIGQNFQQREVIVGAAMANTAAEINAPFVVNVGDNFYWCGVKSVDDPQFDTDFEKIFTQDSLMVPWLSALGNHDYGYSVEAQLEYKSPNQNRWVMPSRYFTRKQKMSETRNMTVIVIDTNPCVSAYRSDNSSNWDPCSPKFNDCPGCKFHENILSQSCTTQFVWFKDQLAKVPKDDWLVIVGHHPAHEIDVEDFAGAMLDHGFDLYINGHTHELNTYTIDGTAKFVTSGSGSMVLIPNNTASAAPRHPVLQAAHSHQYTWWSVTAGYTSHVWNADLTEVTTKFLAYNGSTLHTMTTQKY